jgi:hypothetical protein
MPSAETLVAFSLILLAAMGLVGLFLAGHDSRSANRHEPPPRD